MKIFPTLLALPLLPALFAASPDEKGFIRDWLIGGAYPSYLVNGAGQGYRHDPLTGMGGELKIRPYAGLRDSALFKADKSKLIAGIGSTNEWGFTEDREFPVEWKTYRHTAIDPVISLDGRFAPIDDHMIVYAACYIESPEPRQITLRIGSDDDYKVFLNGREAGGSNTSQAAKPDTFLVNAELNRGLNLLLLKVVDRTHGCGFCVAVSDRAGKPMTDLKIRLDDPTRNAMLKYKLPVQPVFYASGFFADFTLTAPENLAGANSLKLLAGSEFPGDCRAEMILSRNGAKIAAYHRNFTFDGRSAALWEEPVNLEPGKYVLEIRLAETAVFTTRFEIQDPAVIARRNAELKKKRRELAARIEKLEAEKRTLLGDVENLKREHDALYSEQEAAYQALRQARALAAGAAARSIDEPLAAAPEAIRSRILLNGDCWRIAGGFSRAERRNGYTPPPESHWQLAAQPRRHIGRYFRDRQFPVVLKDPGNPYGEILPAPGWENYRFDESLLLEQFWTRLDIDLGEGAVGRSWRFLCESGNGLFKVYLNGEFCGKWEGTIGTVDIPLTGVRPGENRLEIFVTDPVKAFRLPDVPNFREFGLMGDLCLESAPSTVQLRDVAIHTGFRENSIEVANELANSLPRPVEVRVVNQCVLGGRVRYRLPEISGTVLAGGELTLAAAGVWSDPVLWGIGGKYGDPVLYELVSDLYIDGSLVDRNVQPFGFREFWIAGSDFFLNGRHILLQGDVGPPHVEIGKYNDVFFPLLREDNINTIRNHGAEFDSPELLRSCDRLGMLAYVNMYPVLHLPGREKSGNFVPIDEFLASPMHEFNLRNYRRWFKLVRNHPSVVILSTDNEIFTQAWDTPAQEEFNVRNDRLGALYGQYVKSLDPARVVTRNGDVGTWGFEGKWKEEPPADVANYHYPDFSIGSTVINWQSIFGFRPVIYGETLYWSYGPWDKWIGAIPSQVEMKARKVAEVAGLYRELKVPAQIYMGLSHDGFVIYDETGEGNVWGVRASEHKAERCAAYPGYPWFKLPWPAMSGPGRRLEFVKSRVDRRILLNWFLSGRPTHIRNAVNDAYRNALSSMPPLAKASDAECMVELGEAARGEIVDMVSVDLPLERYGAVADRDGKAWLRLPYPGRYRLTAGGESRIVDIPSRGPYAAKPGFDRIPVVKMKETEK